MSKQHFSNGAVSRPSTKQQHLSSIFRTWFLHGSIKKRLLQLLCFTLLPALLFFVWSNHAHQQHVIDQAEDSLLTFSQHLAEMQNQATRSTKFLLKQLSNTPQVQKADIPGCNQLFKQVLELNPMYGALHLVDTNGDIIASGSARGPANFAHTKHFKDALQSKNFATGEFLLGVTLKVPVFTFSYPVRDHNGQVRGVLLTSYLLSRYEDTFKFTSFPKDSFIGIVDHKGRRLFHYPETPGLTVGSPINADTLQHIRSGSTSGLFTNRQSDGIIRISAYQQLRFSPQSPPYMYIIIGMPKSALEDQGYSSPARDFILLAVSLSFALLLVWIVSARPISHCIESLAQASMKLGKGDLSVRVNSELSVTELAQLAEAFNSMAEALENDAKMRIQTQEEIRENEERFRSFFELGLIGMAIVSPEMKWEHVNDRLCDILGYSRKELEQKTWADLTYPGDMEKSKTHFNKVLSGELDQYAIEKRYIKRNGELIYTEVSTRCMRKPDGSVNYFMAMIHDVTERKHAEADRQHLFQLINNADSIAVMKDPQLRYLNANKAYLKFTGYENPRQLMGKTDEELFKGLATDQQIQEYMDNDQKALLLPEGEFLSIEENYSDDGKVRTFLTKKFPIYSKEPKALLGVGTLTSEITDLKRLEQSLLDAKEEAEAANKAKSEFLANMSHEIRTPLNGLMGMLQLINTTPLTADQKDYIDHALESSKRLLRLLTDILDLSRVEAGKMDIVMEPFDVKDAIEGIAHLFSPTAKEKGLDLRVKINSTIPEILVGDVARLQQILSNLVGNAIKFTNQGFIKMEASPLPSTTQDEYRILFSIKDTGIGISDGALGILFSPFTQEERNYKRQFQGAGLGLAICKRLVTLMGGSITVESEEGVGSTFLFCIPFKKFEIVQPLSSSTHFVPATADGNKVLVAEDDMASSIVVIEFLKKLGHEVQTVEDGAQALEKLQKEPFDVVFMDIQMPVLDGLETTKAIRRGDAGERHKHIPIIAMTAYAMAGDKENFLAAGMNAYISKPLDFQELEDVFDNILSGKKTV